MSVITNWSPPKMWDFVNTHPDPSSRPLARPQALAHARTRPHARSTLVHPRVRNASAPWPPPPPFPHPASTLPTPGIHEKYAIFFKGVPFIETFVWPFTFFFYSPSVCLFVFVSFIPYKLGTSRGRTCLSYSRARIHHTVCTQRRSRVPNITAMNHVNPIALNYPIIDPPGSPLCLSLSLCVSLSPNPNGHHPVAVWVRFGFQLGSLEKKCSGLRGKPCSHKGDIDHLKVLSCRLIIA